jgi:hypothetical protein
MAEETVPQIPPELAKRLEAAGVTDDASLQAALERDPQLRANFEAFVTTNKDAIARATMAALITAFARTKNPEELGRFWQTVPTELKEPFLKTIEGILAEAEQGGDSDTVNQLRPRFDDLKRALAAQREVSPTVRALLDFVNVDDEAAARAVFQQNRALLQPFEAQRTLDERIQSDEPEAQQRIIERRALLRELRGAMPRAASIATTAPTIEPLATPAAAGTVFDNRSAMVDELYQAQTIYKDSAHAEGGGTAMVTRYQFGSAGQ